MTTDRRPLLLLDTASLYYRAFYGVPDSVRAPDGTPVNAVRGLLDMTARLVAARRPARIVACWDDDWRPAFRVAALPSYKAHRVGADGGEDTPPALASQVPVIVELLAALGVARIGAAGYEADDIIGSLTTRERAVPDGARIPVEIVTGDRDLFQLVDDSGPVRVLYPQRGGGQPVVIDQAYLVETHAVPDGDAYVDMAALRGDPSDGLPGVEGIGAKTAAALVARFGSLAGVLAALETGQAGLTATQRTRLTSALPYLAVAPGVVRVVRDIDLPTLLDGVPGTSAAGPADADALAALSERWGLASSIARIQAAFDAI